MPDRKKTTGTGKRTTPTKKKNTAKKTTKKSGQSLLPPPDPMAVAVGIFALVLSAFFLAACLYVTDRMGTVGGILHDILSGLFGGAAYFLPILLLLGAVFLKKDAEEHAITLKVTFGFLALIFIGVLFHCGHIADAQFEVKGFGAVVAAWYKAGVEGVGGGVFGGAFAWVLHFAGLWGTLLITIPVLLLLLIFYVGMTPRGLYVGIQYYHYKHMERREAVRAANAPSLEQRQAELDRRRAEVEEMRRAQAERQKKERELRAEETELRRAERRSARIDSNIYTDAAAESQPPEPVEVTDYGLDGKTEQKPEKKAPPVSMRTEPEPEPKSRETQNIPAETIAAETKTEESVPDLGAIFSSPKDEELLRHYGPSVPVDRNADGGQTAELDVVRGVPDGCGQDAVTETEPITEQIPAEEEPQTIPAPADADVPDKTVTEQDIDDAETLLRSLNALYGISGENSGEGTDAPEAQAVGTVTAAIPAETPPQYVFPPVTLLKKDINAQNEDDSDELEENGEKLVGILRSFNVKTKIVNISRGPTVTRYELQPEAGTRVRSVTNLVDDIALGMAASGVRIEAPIPGKNAIGIEVPNQTVSTVYIRDLIECDAFKLSQSRLTTCLGMDVAGSPVYLDVAKMPHLLICGATGTGKSVCINALIVSMLYKAKPEEVKLILVDPKKVELNIYSGIPHLLVPVVSDPKKAAGALHWAVTEMERRFELIEDVGMRDIKGYNEITKNDPDREHMSQIVIIIDELADLMMTAPDDVEDSICRIAQKARAAGMHLIIGTQRPSVDVITGLIKANIPSRIAFRVSAQIDSRIVLDTGGAEKLIGRGDMLYAPIGAAKPLRVQGAFVSEDEVGQITTFLKKTAGHAEYANDVMESIEREAALCGQKKGVHAPDEAGDGDDGEEDPMLRQALELAIDTGKISTSLIQRKLSLGYGRAAKLIDRMVELGYVSEPEGQKPRQVLITREQFMELVMNKEGI